MEIDTALTGRRFDNSPWQISIPTVPWEFSWEITVFFFACHISTVYLGRSEHPSRPEFGLEVSYGASMGDPWG